MSAKEFPTWSEKGEIKMSETPTKSWYKSKLVWLGVILFLMGAVPVFQELFAGGSIDIDKVLTAIGGLLAVVFRVFFTDTALK